jgi:transcriptional regulator with XRE-family HTH domain
VSKNRNDIILKNFGAHLKKMRIQKKLTQETLAFDANIPISQVGRIERGEINPTLSTLYTLSVALHITILQLMDFGVFNPNAQK